MDASGPLAKLSILVVDDDATMRDLVTRMLRQVGVGHVVEAADGMAAWEKLQNATAFDIVISDWNMPRMNGIEVLERVRAGNPRCGVLMMTGRTDAVSVQRALRAGAGGYLVKPFSKEQLRAKVAALATALGLDRETDPARIERRRA